MEWDTERRQRQQLERRLNQIGSMVKGNQDFQADRIADVVEQIAELREELKAVSDRVQKIAEYLNKHRKGKDAEA